MKMAAGRRSVFQFFLPGWGYTTKVQQRHPAPPHLQKCQPGKVLAPFVQQLVEGIPISQWLYLTCFNPMIERCSLDFGLFWCALPNYNWDIIAIAQNCYSFLPCIEMKLPFSAFSCFLTDILTNWSVYGINVPYRRREMWNTALLRDLNKMMFNSLLRSPQFYKSAPQIHISIILHVFLKALVFLLLRKRSNF